MDHKPDDAGDYGGLPGEHVTADQIVAMNVRHWRIAGGLKQHELAERAGISKANMSALERSADGERNPRRFDAQAILTLAMVLNVPIAALFLPPPDDGISKRYLVEAGGECHDMAVLVTFLISDPPDPEFGPLAVEYRDRYFAAVRRYTPLDPDDEHGWFGDLANAERRRAEAERIRRLRAALAEEIGDLDRRAEALADESGLA